MLSLSDRTSDMALVPRTFLRVVAARRRVDFWASWTLHTAMMGSKIRKYTTASTATVTESLVRIYSIQTKNKGNNHGELMSDTTVTESMVRIYSIQTKNKGNNLGELMSATTVTESLVRIYSIKKKQGE